jgi:NAD+ diphosphatase
MIGCIAEVANGSEEAHAIDLGHDPELNDAKWFEFEPIRAALEASKSRGFNLMTSDGFRVPPPQAIAHHLIAAIVNGNWKNACSKI